MIPLLTLARHPGDAVTAIPVGGFMIHGIQPGPMLFVSQGELGYTIFAALILATMLMLMMPEFWGLRIFVKLARGAQTSCCRSSWCCAWWGVRAVEPHLRRWSIVVFACSATASSKGGIPGGTHHRLHPRPMMEFQLPAG